MGEMSKQLSDAAVHEIRTRIKKMRGLLRLVRADIGAARYEQIDRRLQRTSHSLARARDARVMLSTCQSLLQHRAPADCARYLSALRQRLKAARKTLSAPRRRTLTLKLISVQKAVASWPESDGGWKELSKGLRLEYADARDALQTVRLRANAPRRLHELRKRSKGLLYMCEFLGRISPHAGSKARQLKAFAACLGTVHDMSVLIGEVRSARIARIADQNQIALRQKAWRLGVRIFRESPAMFTRRAREEWRNRR